MEFDIVVGILLIVFAAYQILHVNKTKRKPMSKLDRGHIWIRDGKECQYCGKTIRTLASAHIDHIVPLAQGGSNDEDNLVLACVACNRKKGARTPRQAKMRSPGKTSRSWVSLGAIAILIYFIWAYIINAPH